MKDTIIEEHPDELIDLIKDLRQLVIYADYKSLGKDKKKIEKGLRKLQKKLEDGSYDEVYEKKFLDEVDL